MSRIALVGKNSYAFVKELIKIWNNGDCAVLLDSTSSKLRKNILNILKNI